MNHVRNHYQRAVTTEHQDPLTFNRLFIHYLFFQEINYLIRKSRCATRAQQKLSVSDNLLCSGTCKSFFHLDCVQMSVVEYTDLKLSNTLHEWKCRRTVVGTSSDLVEIGKMLKSILEENVSGHQHKNHRPDSPNRCSVIKVTNGGEREQSIEG